MLDGARRAVELADVSDRSSRAEAYRQRARAARGRGPRPDRALGGGCGDGARRRHRRRALSRDACARRVSRSSARSGSGMRPDVICRAEDLPVRRQRVRPRRHPDRAAPFRRHRGAVGEMARVSSRPRRRRRHAVRERAGRGGRAAAATRRTSAPTPRTSGALLEGVGLEVEQVESFEKRHPLEEWLDARAPPTTTRRASAARRPDRGGRVRGHEAGPQGAEGVVAIIVDKETKLVVQGLTGSEGSFHGLRNKRYGTQVVAGVTPGKGGQDVEGIPVFDTVADAVAETGANTTMVFVPARFAAGRDLRGRRRRHRDRHLHRRGAARARDAPDLHLHPAEGRDDARPELPGRALAGQGERWDHPGRDLHRGLEQASSRARAR